MLTVPLWLRLAVGGGGSSRRGQLTDRAFSSWSHCVGHLTYHSDYYYYYHYHNGTTTPPLSYLLSPCPLHGSYRYVFCVFNCMFYQLLRVQLHSCSSTQSWGSALLSIVETRDQNSRGCPLLFSNRNLGPFCA